MSGGGADRWLMLGRVGRPHGMRGHFFVSGRSEPIPRSYGEVRIGQRPETAEPARLEASFLRGGRPVLLCSLAQDRRAAQQLTHQFIWIRRCQLPAPAQDEFLWADLEGRRLVDVDGVCLGTIKKVYNLGASDLMEVVDQDGASVDIPLVSRYVELDSSGPDEAPVRLVVGGELFEGLWSAPGKGQ